MKIKVCAFFLVLILGLSLPLNSIQVQAANLKRGSDEEYSLNIVQKDLLLGDSFELTVDGITDEEVSFRSMDSSVVSLEDSENGCICVGESVGSVIVVVKIKRKGGLFFLKPTTKLRCRVDVTPKAASVKFKKRKYNLTTGAKKKVAVILRPSITSEMPVFTSSAPNIVSVNANGRVVARASGTAIITATIQNGMEAYCKIIVDDPDPVT